MALLRGAFAVELLRANRVLFLTRHLSLGEHLGVFGSSIETKLERFPPSIHGAAADPDGPPAKSASGPPSTKT